MQVRGVGGYTRTYENEERAMVALLYTLGAATPDTEVDIYKRSADGWWKPVVYGRRLLRGKMIITWIEKAA
jgi:hypothetical protein